MAEFQQVIKWLKEGKKVTRKSWHKEVYIFLSKWSEHILYWDKAKFGFQLYDIEATDWEIYEKKETLSDKITNHHSLFCCDVASIQNTFKQIEEDLEQLKFKFNSNQDAWYKGYDDGFNGAIGTALSIIEKRLGDKLK